jgi:hypothetical protein
MGSAIGGWGLKARLRPRPHAAADIHAGLSSWREGPRQKARIHFRGSAKWRLETIRARSKGSHHRRRSSGARGRGGLLFSFSFLSDVGAYARASETVLTALVSGISIFFPRLTASRGCFTHLANECHVTLRENKVI